MATGPISLTDLIPQGVLDQFYQQAVQAAQNADANNKAGIAASAAARGQAWMNVDVLVGDYLDTNVRGAFASAFLDLLAKLYQLALQLQLENLQYEHAVSLQELKHQHDLELAAKNFDYDTQLTAQKIAGEISVVNAKRDADIAVLVKRQELNDASWQEYLAFIKEVYTTYWTKVDEILSTTITTDSSDFILAIAEVTAAKSAAVRQPILPPAPPRV